MEVVYYYDFKSEYCPVKKYLEKYISGRNDNQNKVNKKEKILVGIREKILFIQKK